MVTTASTRCDYEMFLAKGWNPQVGKAETYDCDIKWWTAHLQMVKVLSFRISK